MMRIIFISLAIFAAVTVLCTGSGVLWLSKGTLQQAKQDSARTLATSLSYSLSSQMVLFEHTIEQIASDEDVVLATESADPLVMAKIALKMQKILPNALKIRLLPASIDAIDESSVPNMGYADLDMVKKTLTGKQSPIIQGEGENRHLAITAVIKKDNQAIGVVLASLSFDFIKKTLDDSLVKEHFIQISQADVILDASGDTGVKVDAPTQIMIANTPWQIAYWSASARDFVDISLIMGVILAFGLLVMAALFAGYYQIGLLLKNDQNKVLEAVKDLMTGKEMGGYQVKLTEMQIIISTLAQFKRILDNKQSRDAEHRGMVKLDDRDILNLPPIEASPKKAAPPVNKKKK